MCNDCAAAGGTRLCPVVQFLTAPWLQQLLCGMFAIGCNALCRNTSAKCDMVHSAAAAVNEGHSFAVLSVQLVYGSSTAVSACNEDHVKLGCMN